MDNSKARRGRPSKQSRSFNGKLSVYSMDILEKHCSISGQSKTVAVERAILSAYEKEVLANCPQSEDDGNED